MVEGRRLTPESLLLARFIHPVDPEENRKPDCRSICREIGRVLGKRTAPKN